MRSVNRVISTSFWEDEKVVNLFSPEDKYFYLYILTNPHTTQLGIYKLIPKTAAFELGYSVDAVKVLIDRFENKYNLVKWSEETSEIAIKNFLKHSVVKGGKPVMDCLIKEEKQVSDTNLLQYIYNSISNEKYLNTTVTEYVNHLYSVIHNSINTTTANDNDNDNDNERIVDDSYHDSFHESLCKSTDLNQGFKHIIETWNKMADATGIPAIVRIQPNSNRYRWLKARLAEYGEEAVLDAIANVRASTYLRNTTYFSFDWFVRPNNFIKVLEGNYGKAPKKQPEPEPEAEQLDSDEVDVDSMTEEEYDRYFESLYGGG